MNLRFLFALPLAFILTSCASGYRTPTRQADMSLFTDPSVKQEFEAKPAMHIPANIAVVRIQKPERNPYFENRVADADTYRVVTKRDIETQKDFDKLSNLPGVEGVVTLSRLLLPPKLTSDLDLRKAAARLHADAILIYTFETTTKNESVFPLASIATLGLAPDWKYEASSTVSAVLMDTKTGFIYGAVEEDETRSGVTIGWFANATVENKRKAVERAAFDDLMAKFESLWSGIYAKYNR